MSILQQFLWRVPFIVATLVVILVMVLNITHWWAGLFGALALVALFIGFILAEREEERRLALEEEARR